MGKLEKARLCRTGGPGLCMQSVYFRERKGEGDEEVLTYVLVFL